MALVARNFRFVVHRIRNTVLGRFLNQGCWQQPQTLNPKLKFFATHWFGFRVLPLVGADNRGPLGSRKTDNLRFPELPYTRRVLWPAMSRRPLLLGPLEAMS